MTAGQACEFDEPGVARSIWPALTAAEVKKIKDVAVTLLATLKAEKLKVDQWRDKEATRDAVRLTIKDFLWNDETGLPVDYYDEDEVRNRAK